ncbi:hypothetical protein DFJ73DRAFT_761477 [Zopfochytrium polystomum]|nr:hypothetical protein DFJ73DRAFT_761477 [Zopfochytrium polystomum]
MPPPPPSRLTLPFALPLLLLITSLLRVHSAPAPGNHHGHSHRFAKIVAFGDSWSDTGNFYRRVSNGTWPPAALGYDGGRYSNGPVWLETVALPRFLDAELVDFAYGGASTNGATVRGISGPSNTPSPSVNEQIDNDFANYLKNKPLSSIGTETLYTMWSGANDFFEDFFLYHYNLTAEKSTVTGALYIVVLNIPNPARFPILASVSQPGIDHLQSLAIQFNKSLKEKVKQFNRDTLKVRVLYYDFFSTLRATGDAPVAVWVYKRRSALRGYFVWDPDRVF